MSEHTTKHERVYELTALVADGSIDAAGMAELDALLAADAGARLAYMRYLDLHAEIGRRAKLRETGEAAGIVEAIPMARVTPGVADPDHRGLRAGLGGPRRFAALHRRAWGVRIAAAVVVAGGLTVAIVATMTGQGPTEQPKAVVGVVVDAYGAFAAEGEGEATPLAAGAQVRAGALRIVSGVAEIEMSSGAVLRVEGPAELSMVSDMAARLRSGRIAAHVPAEAAGYAVFAPGFTLTDLGTEFGMSVEGDGSASVYVFEGSVQLDWPSGARRIVTAGGGTAIGSDGAVTELSEAEAGERVATFGEPIGRVRGVPVTSGLIGYWRFDGVGDSLRVENQVPGGKLGSIDIAGGRFVEEEGETGFRPEGSGSRAAIRFADAYPAITISMRLRIDSLAHQELTGLVMSDRWGLAGTLHYQVERDGTLVFHLAGDERYAFDGVVGESELGRWMRLTVVYDGPGGSVTVYRDGARLERRATKVRTAVGPDAAQVGMWAHDGDAVERVLNGAIGDLAIYQRALTETEAARLGDGADRE